MSIISVSEAPFSGGEEFAKALAQRLGLRYVDAAILIERAAAWGGDREKLRAAFQNAPSFLDRFTRRRQIQTVLLRAALAEDLRNGSAVCYGIAADLLSLETRKILRIEVQASHRFRRLQVQQRLKFPGPEAERYLSKYDRNRRRWLIYLFGAKRELPLGFDLMINLEQMSFDAAYTVVFEMMLDRSRFATADLALLENFALSTRIQSAFALDPDTSHLDLDVDIRGDTATLRGKVRSVDEIDSIQHVALPIPTDVKVDYSQIELGGWDYVPPVLSGRTASPHGKRRPSSSRRPLVLRPAWLAASISVMFFLVVGGSWVRGRWFHPPYTHLLSIAGVITDSQCGITHKVVQQTAECVRSCVRATGAKYVLSDGNRNFVLTDQQTADKFAAQRVVATGYLDEITGDLQLRSIRTATQ